MHVSILNGIFILKIMDFLEKDLEDIIYENQEVIKKYGLHCFNHSQVLRQVYLGAYGVADLIGIDVSMHRYPDDTKSYKTLHITIYELKSKKITPNTFSQVARYQRGVLSYREKFVNINSVKCNTVIIGNSFSKDACYLLNTSKTDVYLYEYTIDGIHFRRQINPYVKIEENFRFLDLELNFARKLLNTTHNV